MFRGQRAGNGVAPSPASTEAGRFAGMSGGEAVAVITPRGTKALVKTRVEAKAPDILTMPTSLERATRFILDAIHESGIYE